MEKEPWQEDIYENQEEESRTERRQRNKKVQVSLPIVF